MVRTSLAGFLVLSAAVLAASPGSVDAAGQGYATGKTLSACVKELGTSGGWCEIASRISDVWPEKIPEIDGSSGRAAMLTAWTGMAVDRKRGILYFPAGGGHADYGGNEVYAFDLGAGRWSRLTDPCPLTVDVGPGQTPYGAFSGKSARVPDPSCGPSSSHTYDGVQFSRTTGTIFWVSSIYFAGSGTFNSGRELWEFNPSRKEKRNGLAPLAWKMHRAKGGAPLTVGKGFATSVELPDGRLAYQVNQLNAVTFDPADPAATMKSAPALNNNYGDGNAIWDSKRKAVWFLSYRYGLFRTEFIARTGSLTNRKTWAGFGHGAAVRKRHIVTWDGFYSTTEYDPETGKVRQWDWTGRKPHRGNKNVFSKWIYLPKQDVFVGLSHPDTGVLVYRHPESGGRDVDAKDPQKLIDAASANDDVTIPPGVYGYGITITKPLTVHLKGVKLLGIEEGRGRVFVKSVKGPVIIDGLTTTDAPNCRSNCAGVRVQGADYDVTIRNSHILGHEMGVLTDNRGGRLTIESSEIGETGGGSDLSHVIYAGYSDVLIIRNSIIHTSKRLGHLVKSRAAHTVIANSHVLGRDGRHSRVLEIPCGGKLEISGSTLQQSRNTDNAEFIMVGGVDPTQNCKGNPIRQSSVSIVDTVISTDRRAKSPEPDWKAGPGFVIKWRAPNAPDILTRNVSTDIPLLPGG